MDNANRDEILAVIEASAPRRWMGVGMLALLGGLLLYIALATPPAPAWQIFLLVIGAAALWLAEKMRRATLFRIELTETQLRSSDGVVIAELDQIEAIDRGFFAFKPSNGFMIRTRTAAGGRSWQPGLWWRLGRRVGVGGVTPGAQGKTMSEILAAMIARREDGGDGRLTN